jgi:rare lipoprotein A
MFGAPVVIAGCLLIAGCASTPIGPNEQAPTTVPPPPVDVGTASTVKPAAPGKGGYYLDDGPGENPPDVAGIPDAVPRTEPLHRAALRPYSALGRDYTPMTMLGPYRARGVATWYGKRYHGKPTSTGERYDMYGMTAAHTTLPLPSYVRVTSIANGRSVVVRVNDRGPFKADRLIDLSYAAAWKLGLVGNGSGEVEVEAILPDGKGAPADANTATGSPTPSAAAQPPALPSTNGAVPLTATTGVFLQLGAFSEAAFAEDFARKMRVELADVSQPVSVTASDKLYRVQSGPFPDRDSARREADRLAGRLGSRPFVVTR